MSRKGKKKKFELLNFLICESHFRMLLADRLTDQLFKENHFQFLKNEAIYNFRKNEKVYKKGNRNTKYSFRRINYVVNRNPTKICDVTLLRR